MTLPHGTEVKTQYAGNSGEPAEVVGIKGSGGVSQTIVGSSFGDFLATYMSHIATMGMAGLTPVYVDANLATATPVGTISEKTKSPEQIAFEKRKARLVDAVRAMRKSAPNWYALTSMRVNDLSAQSAEKFLECLPGNALLPRVAPDGEGDIMFVWGDPGQPNCVVTVEKRALHLARGLGTPNVQHVDGRRFLGVQIPRPILERIPSK
jgi:hypothetical protein